MAKKGITKGVKARQSKATKTSDRLERCTREKLRKVFEGKAHELPLKALPLIEADPMLSGLSEIEAKPLFDLMDSSRPSDGELEDFDKRVHGVDVISRRDVPWIRKHLFKCDADANSMVDRLDGDQSSLININMGTVNVYGSSTRRNDRRWQNSFGSKLQVMTIQFATHLLQALIQKNPNMKANTIMSCMRKHMTWKAFLDWVGDLDALPEAKEESVKYFDAMCMYQDNLERIMNATCECRLILIKKLEEFEKIEERNLSNS